MNNLEEIQTKILEDLSHGDRTKKELMSTLWITDRKVTLVLQELIKEGKIFRKGSSYSLVPKEPKKQRIRKVIEAPQGKESSVPINILRGVFATLSIGGSAISIRNTSVYLCTAFPAFWAYMLSSLMSLFMVSAFSAMVLFWTTGRKRVAGGIGVLFIIVTLYSMSSTVIGMYTTQNVSLINKIVVTRIDSTNNTLYNMYEKQEKDIQALIEDKSVTLARYNKLIAPFEDITSKDYKALSWNISQAEAYIQKKTDELGLLSVKKIALVDKMDDTEVIPETFYEMIQRLFGLQASLVQFLLACMAGIFVDAIVPIAGGLALFLKKEK